MASMIPSFNEGFATWFKFTGDWHALCKDEPIWNWNRTLTTVMKENIATLTKKHYGKGVTLKEQYLSLK